MKIKLCLYLQALSIEDPSHPPFWSSFSKLVTCHHALHLTLPQPRVLASTVNTEVHSPKSPPAGAPQSLFYLTSQWLLNATGLPSGLDGKQSACRAGDSGSIPRLGRSPREGNGCPLQYSYLESFMDRGAWWAIVSGSQRVGHN